MSQKRQAALYISLLSSLALAARDGKENDAKGMFSNITKRLREDFCPPFDRVSLLILSSDLYALALCRRRHTSDKDDERYFTLLIGFIERLSDISSSDYSLCECEELISVCTKKSRTMQGFLYLACVRSLISLIGNAL